MAFTPPNPTDPRCTACGVVMAGEFVPLPGADMTGPDDFTICDTCGHIMYGVGRSVRDMTEAEKRRLRAGPDARATRIYQRQIVSALWG